MMTGGHEALSSEFELNLAPIIDCFTVLIAFVMISTAFASVGILDAGVAAGGETAAQAAPPPVRIGIELKANHEVVISTTGKEKSRIAIGAQDGTWNLQGLTENLTKLQGRWKTVKGAVLSAEDSVSYDEVVKSMDTVRKVFPAVLLGGL